jgi:hypothetical protein
MLRGHLGDTTRHTGNPYLPPFNLNTLKNRDRPLALIVSLIQRLRGCRRSVAGDNAALLHIELVGDAGCRFVHVECRCGHTERLAAAMLTTAGVQPDERVQGLGSRMRCRECDEKGRAVVSTASRLFGGSTLPRSRQVDVGRQPYS